MASKRGRIYRRTKKDLATGERVEVGPFWIQYFFNGQDRRESTHSTKEQVAKKLLTKRMAGKDAGTLQVSSLKPMGFADLQAIIEGEYHLNQRPSLDRLQVAFKALGAMFAGWKANAITKDRLVEYANARLADGKAHATIRYELACLRRAFRLAEVPAPYFPSIEVHNTRTGFFEWPDFCAVLDHLPEYLHAPMTVGYFTGWRVKSELLPLQWSHVDWKAGTITLDAGSTKNKKGRTYPFGQFPELFAVLQAQRKAADQIARTRDLIVPWVFFRVTKTTVERIKSYKTAWTRATQAAGLPHRLVHDLRRTGVRSLRLAGVPEHVAMQLTGHKTRSVFDRYDIVDGRDRGLAVGQLAAFHAHNSRLRDNHGTISPLPLTREAQQHG